MRLRLAAAIVLVVLGGPSPAGAIETAQLGLEPARPAADGKLRVQVTATKGGKDAVRVWNKTGGPLEVRLSVVPATVDAAGEASLGGDPEPVRRVRLERTQVALAPSAEQVVPLEVQPSASPTGGTETVAIVAEPAVSPGRPPAVLARVAMVAYLETSPKGIDRRLTAAIWVGGGLVLVVVAGGVRHLRRKQRSHLLLGLEGAASVTAALRRASAPVPAGPRRQPPARTAPRRPQAVPATRVAQRGGAAQPRRPQQPPSATPLPQVRFRPPPGRDGL